MEKSWNNKAWFMVLPVLVLGGNAMVRGNPGVGPVLGCAGAQPAILRHHPRD